MDPVYGNLWGTMILLSLWSGTAGELQICLERKQPSSGTCKVELMCSSLRGSAVEWFRGNKKVISDQRHELQFGGMILDVTLDSQLGETVYKCKEAAAGVEQTVDLGETCGYSNNIKILPHVSLVQYQKVKIILTAIFLAVYTAALLITFYLCHQQSSKNEKKRRQNQGEEGIYSDLLSPGTQPDTKEQAQATGQRVQCRPKRSSQLKVEVEAGPAAGLRMQAVAGPSTGSIREQAEAGPAASLRRLDNVGPSTGSLSEQAEAGPGASRRIQAESGPSSGSIREQAEAGPAASLQRQDETKPNTPQMVPVQDSTYTSLKKRPKDADYQLLRGQGPDGQSAVTYSAEAEEVTLKTTL
ncbi:uncharacterized protein LOC144480780 [Mustelus asterias]